MSARYSRQASRGHSSSRHAQRPPSPSMEDPVAARFSLPSISSLIEAAHEGTGQDRSPTDLRPQKAVVDPQLLAHGSGMLLNVSPLTQPLSANALLQFQASSDSRYQSPNTDLSQFPHSSVPGSDRRARATSTIHVEGRSQFQTNYSSILPDRPLRPVPATVSSYSASSYSSYGSPGSASTASYLGSPIDGPISEYPSSQTSVPPNFLARPHYDEPLAPYISHSTPAWQHHHHFPPSTSSQYPPNQDRYICPTCSKAFSRPSSLKIHTYSHTGEKPWRCEVPGCGKTFSVRSNMKRHEKGCHGDGGLPKSHACATNF